MTFREFEKKYFATIYSPASIIVMVTVGIITAMLVYSNIKLAMVLILVGLVMYAPFAIRHSRKLEAERKKEESNKEGKV